MGRITGRLSKSYGNEVVNAVLSLLSPEENDNAWHGGCLALAELGLLTFVILFYSIPDSIIFHYI